LPLKLKVKHRWVNQEADSTVRDNKTAIWPEPDNLEHVKFLQTQKYHSVAGPTNYQNQPNLYRFAKRTVQHHCRLKA